MSICKNITEKAEKLNGIVDEIGGALQGADAALDNAITELSPFVEGTGDGEDGTGGTGAGNAGGGNVETGGETI